MTENTITPQDTERQEGVFSRPGKFTKTLVELSDYFHENMNHHKNNLYLFGYSALDNFISEAWNDDLTRSMTDAIEKTLTDAADAIGDFSEKLGSTLDTYREQERGHYEAKKGTKDSR
jgi:hypothetical protein